MKIPTLIALFVLVFGCAGSAPQGQAPVPPDSAAPEAQIPQPPPQASPPPAQAPEADSRFATYENIGISFDYPREMTVGEQTSGYPARATVTFQGKTVSDGAIVVAFFNTSGILSALPDPLDQAEKILKSDSESEDDLAGQAQERGEISKYISPNGVPLAERTFVLVKPGTSGNNVTMYGYALEFYDGTRKASYPVRIFSANQSWTEEMKTRFVSSFRAGSSVK